MPSFSLWSSIASKEAIVVFAMGVMTGFILRLYQDDKRGGLLPILAAAILILYKPYYWPALIFIVIGTVMCQRVRQKALVALIGGLISLGLLYLFRDVIDELAFRIQHFLSHGIPFGRSSRTEPFFVEKYDVFFRAPGGMFLAFLGPKLSEIFKSPLALLAFLESVALMAFFFAIIARRFMFLPAYSLIMGFFTLFWIMFASYPFGLVNIGTTIRYRSGWIILPFAIVAVLMSRSFFDRWRAQNWKT